jgi:Family of unknown function (DUF6788)
MGLTYQRKYIKCGKASCRKQPDRHGPYWYAFWFKDGKTHCRYIGKNLPVDLDQGSKIVPEIAGEEVSSITVRSRAKKTDTAERPARPVMVTGMSVYEARRLMGLDGVPFISREIARKKWYNRTHVKNLTPTELDRLNEAWVILRMHYQWQ